MEQCDNNEWFGWDYDYYNIEKVSTSTLINNLLKSITNNKVMQLPALWRKMKAFHFWGQIKTEID